MQTNILVARVALVMAVCSSGWSFASEAISDDSLQVAAFRVEVSREATAPDVVMAPEVAVIPEVPAAPVAISGFGVPLASGQLDDFRGGFDVVKNDMQLSGTVADNAAVQVLSGNNSIANGSFANSSGFPMVIQNSGSNVLIQNATIINVQYQ